MTTSQQRTEEIKKQQAEITEELKTYSGKLTEAEILEVAYMSHVSRSTVYRYLAGNVGATAVGTEILKNCKRIINSK